MEPKPTSGPTVVRPFAADGNLGPVSLKRSGQGRGRTLAITAACLFGTNGVIAFWFAEGDGKPITMLAFRFLVGGIAFAAVAVAFHLKRPTRAIFFGSSLTGLGHVAFTACLLYGFATASVALIILLFYIYPLLVAIGASYLHKERLTRGRFALFVVGTAGVALAVGTPGNVSLAAVLLGLGAGLGNALVILGNNALLDRGADVLQIGAISYLVPGAFFSLLIVVGVIPAPHTELAWSTVLFYGAIGTMLPFWLFYTAVTIIGAPVASLFATLEPLVAVLLAWLLIGQPLILGQIVGGALILGTVVALSLQQARDGKASEA